MSAFRALEKTINESILINLTNQRKLGKL